MNKVARPISRLDCGCCSFATFRAVAPMLLSMLPHPRFVRVGSPLQIVPQTYPAPIFIRTIRLQSNSAARPHRFLR
jgi:hypothetical protein